VALVIATCYAQEAKLGFSSSETGGPRSVAFAEWRLVQSHQQLADRLIEFRHAEKLAVAQCGHDPASPFTGKDIVEAYRFMQVVSDYTSSQ
jgi:hypothetical protein